MDNLRAYLRANLELEWDTFVHRILRRPGLPHYGRRVSPTPVKCPCCGWTGKMREAVMGYISDGFGDVDPTEFCPKCPGRVEVYTLRTVRDRLRRFISTIDARLYPYTTNPMKVGRIKSLTKTTTP